MYTTSTRTEEKTRLSFDLAPDAEVVSHRTLMRFAPPLLRPAAVCEHLPRPEETISAGVKIVKPFALLAALSYVVPTFPTAIASYGSGGFVGDFAL